MDCQENEEIFLYFSNPYILDHRRCGLLKKMMKSSYISLNPYISKHFCCGLLKKMIKSLVEDLHGEGRELRREGEGEREEREFYIYIYIYSVKVPFFPIKINAASAFEKN